MQARELSAPGLEVNCCTQVLVAAADAYIDPADCQGFPHSVIEATQAELPLVSTKVVPGVNNASIVRVPNAVATASVLTAGTRALENASPADEATISVRSAPFLPPTFMYARDAL
jgi:hypothetical protein